MELSVHDCNPLFVCLPHKLECDGFELTVDLDRHSTKSIGCNPSIDHPDTVLHYDQDFISLRENKHLESANLYEQTLKFLALDYLPSSGANYGQAGLRQSLLLRILCNR